MAIAFDAVSFGSKGMGTTANTLQISHAGGSGSSRIAICFVALSNRTGTGHSVTGVTYDGVAMTSLGAPVVQSSGQAEGWYLIAPNTGTKNVIISYSTGTDNDPMLGHVVTYTGVDQTTGIQNYTT